MNVLIAGTGVAGLEALSGPRALAGDRAHVTLLGPAGEFVYRPMLVAEPFGSADVLTVPIGEVVESTGADHVKDSLVAVDPVARRVATASGADLPYESLLVALGAKPVEAVPGALTFGGPEQRASFARALAELGRRGKHRLAFVVPRAATWSIAAYELALLTAAERDARRLVGVELMIVTHEEGPLDVFGASASELVASRLEENGIALRTSSPVESFAGGELRLAGSDPVAADIAVALPGLEVPSVPGLPQRHGGFVHADSAMQVAGLEHVWAAGDVTWFPVKQGGLAAQQADVAARGIAARAGAHVPLQPWQPVLRAALITGGSPEFFRSSTGPGPDAAAIGRALWSPPTKLAGTYLSPFLARRLAERTSDRLTDVEGGAGTTADRERHERSVALLLSAADADARIGDFPGAIKWLSLVEQLNLVVPPEYVARRLQWRRQLDPTASDAAAERIDPSFGSAAEALSDLQRRIGWMREIEHRTGAEMSQGLDHLDEDMEHLMALSRQTKVLAG